MTAPEIQAFAKWFQKQKCPLICTHVRPDGDAYGSLFGFLSALTNAGIACAGYLSEEVPERYRDFFPVLSNLSIRKTPADSFDSLVCLDTATASRADLPPGVEICDGVLPIANIDHHPDNERFGAINLIAPDKAATASLLVDVLEALDCRIIPSAATCLLTGLLTDCGAFRFRNTDPAALRTAAGLVEAGADLYQIMDRLFCQEPLSVLRLKADLLQKARFACKKRFVYAVLDTSTRARFDVAANETEGVIDILRAIKGTVIACLIQPEGSTSRLSLRSREPGYPVDCIAKELGGGGHPMAAGAELPNTTVPEAENKVLELAKKVLAE